MKFVVDKVEYSLQFEREYKDVTAYHKVIENDKDGKPVEKTVSERVKSKFPYTTVSLWAVREDGLPKIYRTATVGCWTKEKDFTLERGRLNALRSMSRTLDPMMKRAMWESYHKRRSQA